MTIADDYIALKGKYLQDSTKAALCQIPDEHWPTLLAALDIINEGGTDPGIDCGVVITHETLSDFENSRQNYWSEKGYRKEISDIKGVLFEKFQLFKNRPRDTCLVFDIGTKRVVLS